MASDASSRNGRTRARRFAAEVARCGGAAWVIDPLGARVLAANEAGQTLLDLPQPFAPGELDTPLPSLARLREMALGQVAVRREALLFRTRAGDVTILCDVRRLPSSAKAPALLVSAVLEDEEASGWTGLPGLEEPPRDDEATLREIARTIRAGLRDAPQTRPAPDPSDEATTADVRGSNAPRAEPPQEVPAWPAEHLAKLAHELKTPLSAIAAAAEIMKDEHYGPLGDARYSQYAAGIHASARHALAVIGNMLGDRDLERGAALPQFTFAELDVNAIAESAAAPMLPLAERAGLRLHLELAPRLPHVVADATSLKQIILNLLANAMKFTARGGEVWLRTSYVVDGPVHVAVRDTGKGMTAREVYDALEGRDRPASFSSAGGQGIGLPLVRALAEANGAQLSIESTPGKGTEAIVSFAKARVIPV